MEATRTAVVQLARTHRIDVRFAPDTTGPDLTPEFAAWLRERWRTAGPRALGVGGQALGKTDLSDPSGPAQPPTPNPQRPSEGAIA